MRIFDLSAPVGDNRGEPVPVKVDLLDHVAGAAVLGRSHGVTAADFPDGCAISMETVTLSTHCGTHIDAPDLRMFFGPGLLLRFDADPRRGAGTRAELADALVRAGRMPGPGVIVLCDVGAAALWGTDAYFTQFRGISAEATEMLLDAGVQVIGTDAFGFDPPFHAMLDAYRETSRTDALWPAHMLGRRRPYCQIERLSGLTELPADHGFTVACFPIRLTGCGASWTRAVAILDGPTAGN